MDVPFPEIISLFFPKIVATLTHSTVYDKFNSGPRSKWNMGEILAFLA